jgi:GNAT superfamily N-acetyltransferase
MQSEAMGTDADLRFEIDLDDDGFDLFAILSGHNAGHACCTHENRSLCVEDLRVREPFRGRGIGSELLRRVFEKAAELAMHEIWGGVTAKDIGATPFLLAWYERNGFIVSERDDKCIETAVKKISREL